MPYLWLFVAATCFSVSTWATVPPTAKPLLKGFTYMSPGGQNVIWPKLPIKICTSLRVPNVIRREVKPAADVWNHHFGMEIFSTNCAVKDNHYKESNHQEHGIYWITSQFSSFTEKTSLARAIVQYDNNGKIYDGDILLNGEYYEWHKLKVDPKSVLIHELGHLLGLKHFFLRLDSAMNFHSYASGYTHHTLGEYENLVIHSLYQNKSQPIAKYLREFFEDDHLAALKSLESMSKKTYMDHYALGMLYQRLGNKVKAKEAFGAALHSKPSNTKPMKVNLLRQKYADSLWSGGDLMGAEKEFKKAIQENPNDYESLANLGGLYMQMGKKTEGAKYLKQSLNIQPAHWLACKILNDQSPDPTYQKCVARYAP